MPNERSWVFRWIFTIVLPTLFPRYLLSQVKAIITDGCPQEFMQIDMARETYSKIPIRIRCGFYLVRMGCTHHVIKKNCYPSSVGVFYDNVCNHLKAWIYSWMKRSCENWISPMKLPSIKNVQKSRYLIISVTLPSFKKRKAYVS